MDDAIVVATGKYCSVAFYAKVLARMMMKCGDRGLSHSTDVAILAVLASTNASKYLVNFTLSTNSCSHEDEKTEHLDSTFSQSQISFLFSQNGTQRLSGLNAIM